MSTVVVIDYGTSNLRSVAKALEHVADSRHKIIVSNEASHIHAADRIVFPGQGAIGQCVTSLKQQGLDSLIYDSIKTKPFLGICLGLQSLMDHSNEDGGTVGLGIIPGNVVRFQDDCLDENGDRCKIPHMGWNQVMQQQPHDLWKGIENGSRFYFVHSYYVSPLEPDDIAGTTDYTLSFTSAIARENIFATQFHPEKSQKAGLTLLKNFLDWII